MADGRALPFKDGKFEGAYSLRVIWHLATESSMRDMIAEMGRVSSQFLVLDITNRRRWSHPLIRPLAALYFFFNPLELRAHNTSQLLTVDGVKGISEKLGFELIQILPLDVWSPIWLRIFPGAIARSLYPLLFRLEAAGSKLIPSGRFLIRLAKSSKLEENTEN